MHRFILKFMEKKTIVCLKNVVTRLPELRFSAPLNWDIKEGEQWVIIGPNGSGKTLIADTMQQKFALKEGEVTFCDNNKVSSFIKSIAFKDIYSLTDCKNSYYQQRWHSTEADNIPTVEELLEKYTGTEELQKVLKIFKIEELLPKKLIFLSSGELRKFLIVRTLLTNPRLLILDNPFIGLDASSRDLLVEMLEQMSRLKNVQTILLLSNPSDIPPMATHVLPVYQRTCFPPVSREEFLNDRALITRLFPSYEREETSPIPLPVNQQKLSSSHHVTLRMEHVCIKYGTRTIFKELDWEVKNGEKWALLGPNGSGKSALLSLVYADNPQSYANTFYLFDRKRGSGESIWDIKKRIGYVSPEMHLYYTKNVPAIHIVGSGFFDSIGLYRTCNAEQEQTALAWMQVFGIEHLKDRLFLTLSSGEQRLLLLARAFVKDPDLIILDEPLHGLDIHNKKRAIRIIEQFCSRPGKSLIYVTHYPHELPPCVDKKFELHKIKNQS